MAVTLNRVQRGEPRVPGGGELKWYATANATGEVNIDQLSELIEMISTISSIDIAGVLKGLTKVVPRELANGRIVRLGDLGYFRVSVSSEGHATEEEVGANSITNARIIFTPGPEFEHMLNNLEFEISNGAT